MIEVDCYFCGSSESELYAVENSFRLVKCNGCGLLYVNPRPTEEEIGTAHTYGEHTDRRFYRSGRYDPHKLVRYQSILCDFYGAKLREHRRSWLDVGCGWGEFIEAVHSYSHQQVVVKGLEPNRLKRSSAQRRGLDVDYFDLSDHEGKYDVLSLLNVYSHLSNPIDALSRWSQVLRPGGELFIETGDTANLASSDHYRPFYLPDHLSFASESLVCQVLERAGFEVLDIRKYQAFPRTVKRFAKEAIKSVMPSYQSGLRSFFRSYDTDMFIRARLQAQ